jgi:hypothetical protein
MGLHENMEQDLSIFEQFMFKFGQFPDLYFIGF